MCSDLAEVSHAHRLEQARQTSAIAMLAQRKGGSSQRRGAPVIVPYTTVPFFSSICTFSFDSFIRNLWQGGARDGVSGPPLGGNGRQRRQGSEGRDSPAPLVRQRWITALRRCQRQNAPHELHHS